jgi:dTDP-4-dehydrorhamnose 3,5-epimerase-like enzyme
MSDMSDSDAPIHGVKVVPLRRIPDERGTIFHMLRRDAPHFVEFGEIYLRRSTATSSRAGTATS